jgi:MFS family permease
VGVDDREWGFVLCCLALILLRAHPTTTLLYLMVVAQGTLGYGLTSVMGAITGEIFAGRHFGSIFGTAMLAAILGGAASADAAEGTAPSRKSDSQC